MVCWSWRISAGYYGLEASEPAARLFVPVYGRDGVGDRLQCSGLVAALRSAGGERLADLDLIVRNQSGDVKLQGRATVALD